MYKTCRYANPIWIRDVIGDLDFANQFAAAVTYLKRFPKLKIDSMVDELVKYRREISEFRRVDVEVQMERCATFWLEFHARLPHLAAFARYCMQTARMLPQSVSSLF
jgi:hypothetical protein